MEKCKSCIHYGVCKFQGYYDVLNSGGCGDFEDKDLFIKLPCKIGDPLYILSRESPAFGGVISKKVRLQRFRQKEGCGV
jgi:hypothetical protein